MTPRHGWISAVAAIVLSAAAWSCGNSQGQADQNRAAGEYLVTLAPQADARAINDVYGSFDIKSVKPLGNNLYLMQLGKDPGPAAIEQRARSSAAITAIQPNFSYRNREKR